jgi:hypothetical protein
MAGPASIPLSPKQEQALLALLNETSITKAAEHAGVGERTLYRWLEEPAFRRQYKEARRTAFDQAIGLTQRCAAGAVQTLAKVMADPKSPASARVAAAAALLRFGREALELDDLAQRIEVLERAEAERASAGLGGRVA